MEVHIILILIHFSFLSKGLIKKGTKINSAQCLYFSKSGSVYIGALSETLIYIRIL